MDEPRVLAIRPVGDNDIDRVRLWGLREHIEEHNFEALEEMFRSLGNDAYRISLLQDVDGKTLLHVACESHEVRNISEVFEEMRESKYAAIACQDSLGKTPLHYAAAYTPLAVSGLVRKFLENRGHEEALRLVTSRDQRGITPLQESIYYCDVNVPLEELNIGSRTIIATAGIQARWEIDQWRRRGAQSWIDAAEHAERLCLEVVREDFCMALLEGRRLTQVQEQFCMVYKSELGEALLDHASSLEDPEDFFRSARDTRTSMGRIFYTSSLELALRYIFCLGEPVVLSFEDWAGRQQAQTEESRGGVRLRRR